VTFADTLAVNQSPEPSSGLGGTDFWASLMTQLAQWRGGQLFVGAFWRNASTLPAAGSTPMAVANWEHAASQVACADLSVCFYTILSFPRPSGSLSPRHHFSPAALTPTNSCVSATHTHTPG